MRNIGFTACFQNFCREPAVGKRAADEAALLERIDRRAQPPERAVRPEPRCKPEELYGLSALRAQRPVRRRQKGAVGQKTHLILCRERFPAPEKSLQGLSSSFL